MFFNGLVSVYSEQNRGLAEKEKDDSICACNEDENRSVYFLKYKEKGENSNLGNIESNLRWFRCDNFSVFAEESDNPQLADYQIRILNNLDYITEK